MTAKMKRLGALLLAFMMLFSVLPATTLVSAEDEGLNVTKTIEWVDEDHNEIDITIQSDLPPVEKYSPAEVLFLGTQCSAHDMEKNTLEASLNAIAQKGNVTYYTFDSSSSATATYDKHGTLAYGETISNGTFSLSSGNHGALNGFLNVLYSELVTNQNKYDYIILEFDGNQLMEDFGGLEGSSSGGCGGSGLALTYLQGVANALTSYYSEDKVIWVTPGNWDETQEKYVWPYVPSNVIGHEHEGYNEFGYSVDLFALASVVAPSYFLAHQDYTDSTYYGNRSSEIKVELPALSSEYQVNYTDASALCDYLSEVIKGTVTLEFEDDVYLYNKHINVLDAKLQYTESETPTADDWKDYDGGSVSWEIGTVKDPDTGEEYEDTIVSAKAEDLTADVKWMRLKIRVSSTNHFADVITETTEVVDGETVTKWTLNPNDGPAYVEAVIKNEGGTSSTGGSAEHIQSSDDAEPLPAFKVNVTVEGGTGTQEYVGFLGDTVAINFAPNPGYKADSFKVYVDGKEQTISEFPSSGTYSFTAEYKDTADESKGLKNYDVKVVYVPEFTIEKETKNEKYTAGQTMTYTISVGQTTGETLEGAKVTDTVDSRLTIVENSASPAGAAVSGNTITWNDVDLQSGTNDFSFQVQIPATLTAAELAANPITNPSDTCYVEYKEKKTNIDEDKETDVDPVKCNLLYRYTSKTNPSVDAIKDVEADYGTEVTVATPSVTGWIFTGWYDGTDFQTANKVEQGSKLVLTEDTILYGSWKLDTTNLTVAKAVTKVNGQAYTAGTSVNAGDTVTYAITVTNGTVDTVSGVKITDTVPSVFPATGISNISDDGTLTSDTTGNTLTWTLSLTSGQSKTLTFDAKLPQNLSADAQVSNIAILTYGDDDPKETPPSDIPVEAEKVSYSVTKSWLFGWEGDHKNAEVTVGLFNGGTAPLQTVTLNYSNRTKTFSEVPVYNAAGAKIEYTVKELNETGDTYLEENGYYNTNHIVNYVSSGTSFTVTNSNTDDGSIFKTKSLTGAATTTPGATFNYAASMTNSSESQAVNVAAKITLPAGITVDTSKLDTTKLTYHSDTNTVSWNVGTVEGGATATTTIPVKVSSDIKSGVYNASLAVTAANGKDYNDPTPETAETEVRRTVTVKLVGYEGTDTLTAALLNGSTQTGKLFALTKAAPEYSIDNLASDGDYSVQFTAPEGYTVTKSETVGNVETVVTITLEKKSYTITYHFVGNTPEAAKSLLPAQATVKYQDAYTATKVADTSWPEGFTLSDWYTKDDCRDDADKYVDGTKITANLDLYAEWNYKYFNVTYHAIGAVPAGASVPSPAVTDMFTEFTAASVVVPEGYRFDGWYSDSGLTNKFTTGKLTGNQDLYGQWIRQYTVSFEPTGYAPASAQKSTYTVDSGATQAAPAVSVPDGYRFDGWYYQGTDTEYKNTDKITGDTVVEGRWTKLWDVTYEINGLELLPEAQRTDAASKLNALNTDAASKDIVNNTAFTAAALPELGYYEVEGWYTDPARNILYTDGTALTSDLTLYGSWKRKTVTVQYDYKLYDLDGKSLTLKDYTNALYDNEDEVREVGVAFTPTQEDVPTGLRFDGWYTDPACTAASKVTSVTPTDKETITLYGKYVKQVTASYEVSGTNPKGSVPASVTMDIGTEYTAVLAQTMAVTGYEFHGWTLNGTSFTKDNLLEDVTLTGYYETLIKVSYEKSASQPSTLTKALPEVEYKHSGDKYTAAAATDYAVDDYVFDGWFVDADCKTPYTNGTQLTSDLTLYGKWREYFDVVFEDDGAPEGVTVPKQQTVADGDMLTYTANDESKLEAKGWTFVGWYKDADRTQSFNPKTDPVEGDMTLYGKWSRNTVQVTYQYVGDVPAGLSDPTPDTVEQYTPANPGTPSQEGYRFAGWYTDEACKNEYKGADLDEDTILYGKWVKQVKVTYQAASAVPAGKTLPETAEMDINSQYTAADTKDMKAEGYNFYGWYTDANCTIEYEDKTQITEDTVLYGKWLEIFTVTFKDDGAPEGAKVPDAQDKEDGSKLDYTNADKKNLEVKGYTFVGWYKDAGLTQPFDPETDPVTEDMNLYGKWTRNQVSVTYQYVGDVPAGLSNPTPDTIDQYTAAEPDTPAQKGYRFDGWYTDPECKHPYKGGDLEENTTLYGNWVKQVYVSYQATSAIPAGKTLPETAEMDINSKYTAADTKDMKAEGYNFYGWYTDPACTTEYEKSEITEDTVLYGKWLEIFTVTFKDDGAPEDAKVPGAQEIEDGQLLDYTNADKKNVEAKGYTFVGWFKDPALTQPFDPETEPVTGDLNLYGKWTRNEVSVTYEYVGSVPEGVNPPEPDDIYQYTPATPDTPSEDGYSFEGWYTDPECKHPYKDDELKEDTKLYGKWLEIFDVKYQFIGDVPSGAKLPDADTSKEGDRFTPTKPATVTGYSFSGWYTDAECKTEYTGDPLTADTTLYGKWINLNPVSPQTGFGAFMLYGSSTMALLFAAAYVTGAHKQVLRRKKLF